MWRLVARFASPQVVVISIHLHLVSVRFIACRGRVEAQHAGNGQITLLQWSGSAIAVPPWHRSGPNRSLTDQNHGNRRARHLSLKPIIAFILRMFDKQVSRCKSTAHVRAFESLGTNRLRLGQTCPIQCEYRNSSTLRVPLPGSSLMSFLQLQLWIS